MNIRKWIKLWIAGFAAVSIATGAQAADVTLRLGTAVFKSHPAHDGAVRFAEGVKRLTHGAVEVQIYPARQLGDIKELVEGVQFGTIDISITTSSAVADLAPGVDALQLPWLMKSYAHMAKLVRTPEAAALTAPLQKRGVVCLAIFEGGEHHFISNRVIKTIDDFKGLKTRVFPVRLHLDVWRAIGANPTPMAYGEIYSALETKTLDAVDINISSIYAEKYYEVAKQVALTGQFFWPEVLLINKAKLDSLKPEYQAAIKQAAAEAVEPQIMAAAASEIHDRQALEKLGVTFTEPSSELAGAMRKAVEPIYKAYMAKDPSIQPFVAAAERTGAELKPGQ